MNQTPIQERVKRWDIYDIADELADVPGEIRQLLKNSPRADSALYSVLSDINSLVDRLWAAADRSGSVGPYPEYEARR